MKAIVVRGLEDSIAQVAASSFVSDLLEVFLAVLVTFELLRP